MRMRSAVGSALIIAATLVAGCSDATGPRATLAPQAPADSAYIAGIIIDHSNDRILVSGRSPSGQRLDFRALISVGAATILRGPDGRVVGEDALMAGRFVRAWVGDVELRSDPVQVGGRYIAIDR